MTTPEKLTEEKSLPEGQANRKKAAPRRTTKTPDAPEATSLPKGVPAPSNAINCISIGGTLLEIKPTKLKYQRNRTALFYKIMDMYPLPDIFGMEAGAFGDERDGDTAVYEWLIAVVDDEEFVKNHYDEFDTEIIERLLEIFKRLNKTKEKEEKLKNLEANLEKRE